MAGKTQYKNTWQKENVDRVNLTMPKGRKAIIQAHAEAQGQSVNGFINAAIDDKMGKPPASSVNALNLNDGGEVVSLHPETLRTAQKAAQSAGETVPQFVERAVATQAKRDEAVRKMEGIQ